MTSESEKTPESVEVKALEAELYDLVVIARSFQEDLCPMVQRNGAMNPFWSETRARKPCCPSSRTKYGSPLKDMDPVMTQAVFQKLMD